MNKRKKKNKRQCGSEYYDNDNDTGEEDDTTMTETMTSTILQQLYELDVWERFDKRKCTTHIIGYRQRCYHTFLHQRGPPSISQGNKVSEDSLCWVNIWSCNGWTYLQWAETPTFSKREDLYCQGRNCQPVIHGQASEGRVSSNNGFGRGERD